MLDSRIIWIQSTSVSLRSLMTHSIPLVDQLPGQVVYKADTATQVLPWASSSENKDTRATAATLFQSLVIRREDVHTL